MKKNLNKIINNLKSRIYRAVFGLAIGGFATLGFISLLKLVKLGLTRQFRPPHGLLIDLISLSEVRIERCGTRGSTAAGTIGRIWKDS